MRRIQAIYQKFGFYQAARIFVGGIAIIGIPILLLAWQGWIAAWTIPLTFIAYVLGMRQGKTGFQNPRHLLSQIGIAFRLVAVLMCIAGVFPEECWFLIGVAVAIVSFTTAAFFWLLSDPRIVNLDRIPAQ